MRSSRAALFALSACCALAAVVATLATFGTGGTATHAAAGLPAPPLYSATSAPGDPVVLVWRDEAAHNRGVLLFLEGVKKLHPELIRELIACVVESGTRVLLDSGGASTSDVTVIEGPSTGCRGNISTVDLQQKP
jgi:hypothetical protein